MEHLIWKVSSKIVVLYRSSKKLSTDAKRQYYLSVIHSDLAYGSNAFYSSLPQSAKEHHSRLIKRGMRAIFGAPPWSHTEPLLRKMKLCSNDVRFKLKLLIHTYWCTHALTNSLFCQQYKLRSPSNSTHNTTRSQLTLSLCIPPVQHDDLALFLHSSLALFFGTLFHHLIDQLLLCTLSGKIFTNISESLLFGQDRPVGFPNKTNKQSDAIFGWGATLINLQTLENETFQSSPEFSCTYESSFEVKPTSGMTKSDFSEVYWYSGVQVVFVTVFQTAVDPLCKNSLKTFSLLGYLDGILSNHAVGCYYKIFYLPVSNKKGSIVLSKQGPCILVVLFCETAVDSMPCLANFSPCTP